MLAAALVLPGVGLWACVSAEVPGPAVCSERESCDGDGVCVMGRCRKKATMPVSTDAPRLVFEPLDLAWVDGTGVRGPKDVASTFVLGKRGERVALYLRFAVEIPPDRRMQRAVLELEPMPRCARRPGRVALSLAQVLAPWQSSEVTVGDQPRLGLPMRLADMSVTPARGLQLDVTELVRQWQQHAKRYHGLALTAAGDSDSGACFSSGLELGHGPQLHIYLWPDEDAGAGGGGGDADAAADGGDAAAGGGDAS
jgi:hypothetical protein